MSGITSRGQVRTKQVEKPERGEKARRSKLISFRIGQTFTVDGKTLITRVDNAKNGDVQLLVQAPDEVVLGRVEQSAG